MHSTDFLEVIKVKLSFISHDFINLLTVLPYLAKDPVSGTIHFVVGVVYSSPARPLRVVDGSPFFLFEGPPPGCVGSIGYPCPNVVVLLEIVRLPFLLI